MMKMKRMFCVEGKRGLFSTGLYLGFFSLAIGGWLTTVGVMDTLTEVNYFAGKVRAFESFLLVLRTELFAFLIPIACTLALSTSYLDDLQSGALPYILLRTTKRDYKWSKVIGCSLFGFITVLLASVLVLILALIHNPPNSEELKLMEAMPVDYYLLLLQTLLLRCLNGSFYALLGGAIAAFVKNRYMAYGAPFIFYYVVSTLSSAYLGKIWLINPKEWMLAELSSPTQVLMVLLILNTAVIVGYGKMIERRWEND
ncbi:hypothetical protein M2145_001306 [Lachnospiraceae bacterium PF1-21]|uniref:hypothetical protein n=1 Tax=Ohessyouella blattaphilus TaxID=2949333 RepID=UPI003E2FA2F6